MRKKRKSVSRFRIKRKKPLYKNKFFWLSVLFLVVFAGIFYLVFFFDFFQVEKAKISGNQEITTSELSAIIEPGLNREIRMGPFLVFKSKSLFFIDSSKIVESILESVPKIGEVIIKKSLPNNLFVDVKERKSFAIFCQPNGECFEIDEKGVAFEKSFSFKEIKEEGIEMLEIGDSQLVINSEEERDINLGKEAIKHGDLESILEIRNGLVDGLSFKILDLLFSKDTLNVRTGQGFKVYFNLRNNIKDQIFNLDLVLKEKISAERTESLEYIDLRFGNRVYYK